LLLLVCIFQQIVLGYRRYMKRDPDALLTDSDKNELFFENINFMINALVITGVGAINLFMIEIMGPVENHVGWFSAVITVSNLMWVFCGSMLTVFSPLFSEVLHDKEKAQKIIHKANRVQFILYTLVFVSLYIKSEWILGLFGKHYLQAVDGLHIYLIGMYAAGLFVMGQIILCLNKKARIASIISLRPRSFHLY